MSDIFHGYERQYCELSANLSRKCTSVGLLSEEQKKQKVTELKSGIDEAESLIRRMDLEARSLPPSQTAALLAKLREYKSDLTNLKREVQKCAASNDRLTSREELLEAGLGDSLTTSDDQRGRLLLATDRLNESGNRIKESRVKLLETEELGVSMLHGLHQQRQTLLHATTTLYGADDNIGKSRKILNSMARRMSKNKWIMGGMISVLVAAILLICYFKWQEGCIRRLLGRLFFTSWMPSVSLFPLGLLELLIYLFIIEWTYFVSGAGPFPTSREQPKDGCIKFGWRTDDINFCMASYDCKLNVQFF